MKSRKLYWVLLLATLGLTSPVRAQLPAPPPGGAAAIATPGGAAVATAAPAAPTKNIWSMFCMTAEQRQACREKFCTHPFGQMIAGAAGPMSAMSGGLFQNKCALPTPTELAKPADSAEGAAAKIKQDELDAKARRDAVRYLGTVDCHYWPEAEAGLINALRADRNECVRFEAALVLNRGCCCTQKTMEALTLTVSGSEKDGNPAETSERVRAAAADALSHCTASYHKIGVEEVDPKKEALPEPRKVQMTPSEYYKKVGQLPREKVVENARQALAQVNASAATAANQSQPAPMGRSRASEGVAGIFAKALVTKEADPAPAKVANPTMTLAPTAGPVYVQTQPMRIDNPARVEYEAAPVQITAPQIPAPQPRVFNQILLPNQSKAPAVVSNHVVTLTDDIAVEGPVDSSAAPAANTGAAARRPEGLFNIIGRSFRPARP